MYVFLLKGCFMWGLAERGKYFLKARQLIKKLSLLLLFSVASSKQNMPGLV